MDKKVLAGLGVLVLIVIGGFLLFLNKPSQPSQPQQAQEEMIETISPEKLGLIFTLRSDKRAAKFEITNTDDIELVEYQISYTKEVDGEEVPEGLIGEVKKDSRGRLAIDYREFGTCSSGVCRYDKVVSDIKLILKITKSDGKVFSAEKTLEL